MIKRGSIIKYFAHVSMFTLLCILTAGTTTHSTHTESLTDRQVTTKPIIIKGKEPIKVETILQLKEELNP